MIPIIGIILLQIGYLVLAPLVETSEGRYAAIPLHMDLAEQWLIPLWNGAHHLHKFPFSYWISIIGMKIFGQNEFGVRLPLLLGTFVLCGCYWFWGRRERHMPLWYFCLFLLSPAVMIFSRNLTTDFLLSAFILAMLVVDNTPRGWLYQGFFLGLSLLTKPPIGLAIFLFVKIYQWWKAPQMRPWDHGYLPRSQVIFLSFRTLLIGLSIPLFWVIPLLKHYPDFLDTFIHNQIVRRTTEGLHSGSGFWMYPLIIFVGLSIFWRLLRVPFNHWEKSWTFAVLLFGLVILFSKTKLVSYPLPILFVIPWLLYRDDLHEIAVPRRRIIGMVLIGVFALILPWSKIDYPRSDLMAKKIGNRGVVQYDVMYGGLLFYLKHNTPALNISYEYSETEYSHTKGEFYWANDGVHYFLNDGQNIDFVVTKHHVDDLSLEQLKANKFSICMEDWFTHLWCREGVN